VPRAPRIRDAGSTKRPAEGFARRYQIIAIGASAGGLHALFEVLTPVPQSLPCGILVVQHLSPDHKSVLADLLVRRTALHVHQAVDGEPILPGTVYIAPPNQHLLAGPAMVRLLSTPHVHHHRPSIDLLFESIAANYGRHAVAVVLSGSGNDGSVGVRAVKMAGGATIAEDPGKAEFNSMPYAAIATGCIDMVLPLSTIGESLVELSARPDE
jgi:two-component system chemotaxis response regulator CheB